MGGSGSGSGITRLDAVREGAFEHPLPLGGRGVPALTGKAGTRLGSRSLAMSLGIILLLVMAITLPFSAKPLHIDDAIFWDFARVNESAPFQLHIPDYRLMGEEVAQWRDTHPPLDALYMSVLMRITGSEAEQPLHLGFVIFPLIAAVSMLLLARRFTRNALAATIALMVTPAVMVMSGNLMADVPLMAFWLAATCAYIYAVDRDDGRLLTLASGLTVIAVFTGYQALALVVFLPIYALINGKLNLRTAAPLIAPVALFGLFAVYNLALYGALPRFSHVRGLSVDSSHLWVRAQGTMLQVGGASVFPLFLAGAFLLRRRSWLWLAPVAAIAAALAVYHFTEDDFLPASAALFFLFMTVALLMVVTVTRDTVTDLYTALKRRAFADSSVQDNLFLAVWLLAMIGGVTLLLPHATAKYALPFFAPLVLLAFRYWERRGLSKKLFGAIVAGAIGLTALIGLATSVADYQLAASYRDYAWNLEALHPTEGNVWFVGEWGFRHYMETQGYRYLTSTETAPAAGDIVVRPISMDWPLDPSLTQRMTLIGTDYGQSAFPVRLMESDAGFYGSYWGMLPFTITTRPQERFDVYQVGPVNAAGESGGSAHIGDSMDVL